MRKKMFNPLLKKMTLIKLAHVSAHHATANMRT